MSEAANKMKDLLLDKKANKPKFDVITNYNALPLRVEDIVETLKLQIESSVYLEDSIKYIISNYQIDEFIEIGPGKVLSGFMKRIDPTKPIISMDKLDDLIKMNL
jgi:[acyl-carrier-protein] S-malonyltransferase